MVHYCLEKSHHLLNQGCWHHTKDPTMRTQNGPRCQTDGKENFARKRIPDHAIRPSTWFLSWPCPLRGKDRADLRHFIHQVAWFLFTVALPSHSSPLTLKKTAKKLLVDIVKMQKYWCFNVLIITKYSLIWAFTRIQLPQVLPCCLIVAESVPWRDEQRMLGVYASIYISSKVTQGAKVIPDAQLKQKAPILGSSKIGRC